MPCTGIPFDVVSIFVSQDRAYYYKCPILTVVSIYRDRGRTVLYKVIFGISRMLYSGTNATLHFVKKSEGNTK